MTANLVLDVKIREKKTKQGEIPLGVIPGVLYGRGIENLMLWFNRREFNKIYRETGESTVFKVKPENGEERNVIIKEVQRDILNGKPIHVDFYQVRMDEEIEASIPLVFVGESAAVKELSGVLVKNMDEIEVKCLPGDLPKEIKVDISKITNFEDHIYVKDLPISEKVELQVDPENVVAMVAPPRTEEEMAELETEVKEDVSKVEGVVKEEKPAPDESSASNKSSADKSAGKLEEAKESKEKE
jgi:large subunit ribosomal protein L25